MKFGIWELLVILIIAMVIFGTGKLGSIGNDLGKAIRGFRRSVGEDDKPADEEPSAGAPEGTGNQDQQRHTDPGAAP